MSIYGEFLKTATDAALEAGALLKAHYSRMSEIRFKGEINLVTETDLASQALLHDRLSAAYPGHDFLAEEGLKSVRGAEFRWVFDPLDGTTNFAHKLPVFCVSIGLERRGELVLGVVYNPMSGELFRAETGQGAFLNETRLHVSVIPDVGRSLVATGFSYDIRETRCNITQHERVILRAQGVRRCGSAALDLCYVAAGRFDGFWELKLSPWDTAAGAVLVREAGGRITDFLNFPVNIYHPEVCASNGLIHGELLGLLNET
jgi:myo-inositol-1(or 4)-monophosphatase